VQDEVDAARSEVCCSGRDQRQRLIEIGLAPVVDIAGDADEPDAVRREAIEVVRHHFHDGRADIADTIAPTEHVDVP